MQAYRKYQLKVEEEQQIECTACIYYQFKNVIYSET